jgi:hypothetical protein
LPQKSGGMDEEQAMDDSGFWQRAQRHMLGYGGDFVPFGNCSPR